VNYGSSWATPNPQGGVFYGNAQSPNIEHQTTTVTGSMWEQPPIGDEEPGIDALDEMGIPKLGGATAVKHDGRRISIGKVHTGHGFSKVMAIRNALMESKNVKTALTDWRNAKGDLAREIKKTLLFQRMMEVVKANERYS
jgi:hypothetical protein